jgi:hypothetical protein
MHELKEVILSDLKEYEAECHKFIEHEAMLEEVLRIQHLPINTEFQRELESELKK